MGFSKILKQKSGFSCDDVPLKCLCPFTSPLCLSASKIVAVLFLEAAQKGEERGRAEINFFHL